MDSTQAAIALALAVLGMAYSAVGAGGSAGYLAVLSFTAISQDHSRALALSLSCIVSAISFWSYHRARFFSWELAWPFVVGGVPMAYLGGRIKLPPSVHSVILALVLLYAATMLVLKSTSKEEAKEQEHENPSVGTRTFTGSAIGLLSGLVGIGGGTFLTPIMVLRRWADPRRAAAAAAPFIFLNSLAGLAARSSDLTALRSDVPLLGAGLVGAFVGGHLGANVVKSRTLKLVLAVFLVFTAGKLLLTLSV